MQVGGEPSQKQIILLFDPESLICKPLSQTNKRSLLKGNGIFPSCHCVKQLLQHVVEHYRDEPCATRQAGNLYLHQTRSILKFQRAGQTPKFLKWAEGSKIC